jgi:hypothetical protein
MTPTSRSLSSPALPGVRADTCDHAHFFSSVAATTAWADAHPYGHIYPVQEAFRLDRQVIRQLGWAAPARDSTATPRSSR